MRPLEATKEMLIMMPDDDPVELLGLEKNEMSEFKSCMEEHYEWVPEDEKGGGDAHHSEHNEVQQSAPKSGPLSLLGLSGGFNFNAGSGSGHGGTAVAIIGQKPKEEPKDILTPGITLVTPVVTERNDNFKLKSEEENAGDARNSTARNYANEKSAERKNYNYDRLSYSRYDPDDEDETFLKTLASAGSSDKESSSSSMSGLSSGYKSKASIRKGLSTGTSRDMASAMTLPILTDMVMVLERELELSRKNEAHRSDVREAASQSENMITKCGEIVAFSRTLDHLQRTGGSAGVFSAAIKLKKRLDREGVPMRKLDSSVSLNSGSQTPSQNGRARNDSSTELPAITVAEVRDFVSSHRACRMLLRVYRHHMHLASTQVAEGPTNVASEGGMGSFLSKITRDKTQSDPSSSSSSSSTSGGGNAISEKELEQSRPLLLTVYEYWVGKRAGLKSSLLRCYHTFIMENWMTQDVLPSLPEDSDPEAMLHAHEQLLKLRRDLDRARLIMDRVRRREKVKRDLVKVAGDAMDSFLSDVHVSEEAAAESKGAKKKASLAAAAASSHNNSKPSRAAKKAAIAKIERPGSTGSSSSGGAAAHIYDYAEITKAPFALEDVDYSKVSAALNDQTEDGHGFGDLNLPSGAGKDRFYGDYNPHGSSSSSSSSAAGGGGGGGTNAGRSSRFHSSPTSSSSGWTADEDRLLLMGVAACGVGRWTEIREDFLLARNSAQMNQRFTRLAKRRCDLVKLNSKAKKRKNDHDDDDEVVTEYSDVRTAYMSPQDVVFARSKLPPLIQSMLEDYNEDTVWEGIALRHLLDMQSKDKRCGRPQKYPLPIPIPKHLQNGGHLSKKRNAIQRPSEMGYNWKGTSNSDGTSYNQLFYSANPTETGAAGSTGQRNGSPSGKRRGRPPKKETLRNRKLLSAQGRGKGKGSSLHPSKRYKSGSGVEQRVTATDLDDSDSIGSWTDDIEDAQAEKAREQNAMREERIRARERLTASVSEMAVAALSAPMSSGSSGGNGGVKGGSNKKRREASAVPESANKRKKQ
jgi:hypothetical protein